MQEPSPAEFTQTVVGSTSSHKTPVSQPATHASIEGRFLPGTLLNGRYRIIAMLGKGGMGEVYRATDLTLGQSVALKFLPTLATSDARWLERFHSEVRIARQVSHPNVCRVYDIGEADGLPFLSMEYVDGEDLATLLRRIGRLPADKAIEISRKACAGLAAAHSKGVVHRDLKPHNIMLDRHGEVLICDFGLAAVSTELNAVEIRQGTPAYMAPEQLKGTQVTQASDIYSLGLVLYELFTGKRAYVAANINEMLNAQEAMSLTRMSSHASDIDPAVENIIRRCLDPDPTARPATALAIAAALPGGDPLAAALAAGQTPSPELVAASESAGLKTRYSVPLLLASLMFLAFFPYLKGHVEMLDYAPLELPPAALRVKSREIAAGFGYSAKPADWTDFFEMRSNYFYWLQKLPGKKWRDWFQSESPVMYAYRESPKTMAVEPWGTPKWDVPSFDDPNMVRLNLDSAGRLRSFEAVPPTREDAGAVHFSEVHLFQAIGMDRGLFETAPHFRTPLTPFDQRVTLKGPHPSLPGASITVQYATWKGRLTSVYMLAPWSPPISDEVSKPTRGAYFQMYLTLAGLLTLLFFSATHAHKNWVTNRADRKGALELFIFRVTMIMLAWLFNAHWVADGSMVNFAAFYLGMALLSGAVLWQLYLALEPALRARWPQSIVTWNRLLSGRLMDAQVGAHVLMGTAMGMLVTVAFLLKDWFNYERSGDISLTMLRNVTPGAWISWQINTLDGALTTGLIIFFTIFGLKVLLRRDWLAMLAATFLLVATNADLYRTSTLWLDATTYFAACLLIIFGIVRFGVLTTVVAVFVTNQLSGLACSSDPNLWFAPYTYTTLVVIAALAVFAFWRSLGKQSLVGEHTH